MTNRLGMFSKSMSSIDILIHILYKEKIIMRRISLDLGITYCHTVKVIRALESNGLIKIEKIGRKVESAITKKGKEVAIRFLEIGELMK